MKPMRTPLKALAATCIGLTAWAATPAMAETVTIGMVNSLTGPHSTFDLPTSRGIEMAVKEINDAGGITVDGENVTFDLISEDAQSKPEFAVAAAQRLLRNDDVHIVFGLMTSGPGMAASTLFARSGVLYFGAFTLMDTLLGKPGGEHMMRTLNADATVADVFVPAAVEELKVSKVGVLLPNEDVSRSIAKVYVPLMEEAGVEVPMVEYFQPDTTDFAPVLRKFQNQGLDGMLVGTNDAQVEAIVRQTTELGSLPTKFMYRGGSGAPGIKYQDQIDGFVWQILTRDLQYADDPKLKDWIEKYKTFTGSDLSPNSYWALVYYDTVFMLADAMEAVGSTDDIEAIADHMKQSTYDGVRQMSFDEKGAARSSIDIGILTGDGIRSIRVDAN